MPPSRARNCGAVTAGCSGRGHHAFPVGTMVGSRAASAIASAVGCSSLGSRGENRLPCWCWATTSTRTAKDEGDDADDDDAPHPGLGFVMEASKA